MEDIIFSKDVTDLESVAASVMSTVRCYVCLYKNIYRSCIEASGGGFGTQQLFISIVQSFGFDDDLHKTAAVMV